MNNYTLKDCEKFKIMIRVYRNIFVGSKEFAKKIGVGKATVFNWIQLEKKLNSYDDDRDNTESSFDTQKDIKCSFNTKSKIKICQAFRLLDTVWRDIFYTEEDFEERLPDYLKIEKTSTVRIWSSAPTLKNVTPLELSEIENFSTNQIEELPKKLEKKSASFMFTLAKKLKSKQHIKEALGVLNRIEKGDNTFKYTHENQIKHLKAILLSHDSIKDWNGAIHILRSLYHSSAYHFQEPEILTLLASNYKRKALDPANSKEEIEMDFLTSSLCLYEDSLVLRSNNEKYYDAINLAYLYKLVDVIEVAYANKIEVEALHNQLSSWKIDEKNWWEVSSSAEFEMLLGNVDLAIVKVNNFLENHKVEGFEINALFRQLRLYIKFTEDANAKRFLREVEESWEAISKV